MSSRPNAERQRIAIEPLTEALVEAALSFFQPEDDVGDACLYNRETIRKRFAAILAKHLA